MSQKLDFSCGTQYTKELEGMLQDFNSSDEVCGGFLENMKKKGFVLNPIEFSVSFFSSFKYLLFINKRSRF